MSPVTSTRQKYFRWLYGQCFPGQNVVSQESHIYLCEVLHEVKFGPGVPNDENRAADGEELRDEFISTQSGIGVEAFAEMASLGEASIFEVLVALSRRAHPIAEKLSTDEWFREFVSNLGLMKFTDGEWTPQDSMKVQRILRRWNKRVYDRNGRGGIFPLKRPQVDQRTVELWYQMSAYMTENQLY